MKSVQNKLLWMGVSGILLTASALIGVGAWQSARFSRAADAEASRMTERELDCIARGVYNMAQTEDKTLLKQMTQDIGVLRDKITRTGAIQLEPAAQNWTAINQFTKAPLTARLPQMTVGGKRFGSNRDMKKPTLIVDEAERLTGDKITIFQRINPQGDLLRIATTVENEKGDRAIGTYIPAVNPDGKPNAVASAIREGRTYQGTAFVVKELMVTTYEPIRDAKGAVIGASFVGVPGKLCAGTSRRNHADAGRQNGLCVHLRRRRQDAGALHCRAKGSAGRRGLFTGERRGRQTILRRDPRESSDAGPERTGDGNVSFAGRAPLRRRVRSRSDWPITSPGI